MCTIIERYMRLEITYVTLCIYSIASATCGVYPTTYKASESEHKHRTASHIAVHAKERVDEITRLVSIQKKKEQDSIMLFESDNDDLKVEDTERGLPLASQSHKSNAAAALPRRSRVQMIVEVRTYTLFCVFSSIVGTD